VSSRHEPRMTTTTTPSVRHVLVIAILLLDIIFTSCHDRFPHSMELRHLITVNHRVKRRSGKGGGRGGGKSNGVRLVPMANGRQMSGVGGRGLGGLGSGTGAMAALLPIGVLLGVKAIGVIKSIFLKGISGIGGAAGVPGGDIPIMTNVPAYPPGFVPPIGGVGRRRKRSLSSN
jgi:hypothetical protein